MNEIEKSNGGNLLTRGLEIMKDPNASTPSKIGAVGLMGIGVVGAITIAVVKAMSGSK